MKYYSHLKNAATILDLYEGKEPFHHFIKGYFKAERKFGSRDRRQVAHLCYCFFRLGKAMSDYGMEERIVVGLFLASEKPDAMLEFFRPDWNLPQLLEDLDKKTAKLQAEFPTFSPLDLFPFSAALSDGVERLPFSKSHARQPDLFLRVRPGYEKNVHALLDSHPGIIGWEADYSVRIENSTKLDEVVDIDRQVVVQDLSSQRTIELFPEAATGGIRIWDCCAASGGKSLMAWDHYHGATLTVSDKRESILANLADRFKKAGIRDYDSIRIDLASDHSFVPSGTFDLVIADLPCTGSGTWGRSPENLSYTKEQKIGEYQALQRAILDNIIPAIRPGGWLVLITCSVFRAENEENVAYLQSGSGMFLESSMLIKGYDLKADTMFAARLRKS